MIVEKCFHPSVFQDHLSSHWTGSSEHRLLLLRKYSSFFLPHCVCAVCFVFLVFRSFCCLNLRFGFYIFHYLKFYCQWQWFILHIILLFCRIEWSCQKKSWSILCISKLVHVKLLAKDKTVRYSVSLLYIIFMFVIKIFWVCFFPNQYWN